MPAKNGDNVNFRGKKKVYYQRLVEMRDELIDEVQALSRQSLHSHKQAGEELADIGSDNFNREMDLSLMSEEDRHLQLVQEAILALKEGTYGTCMDCEKKIQEARLEAKPHARLCIQCKSKREKMEESGFLE